MESCFLEIDEGLVRESGAPVNTGLQQSSGKGVLQSWNEVCLRRQKQDFNTRSARGL